MTKVTQAVSLSRVATCRAECRARRWRKALRLGRRTGRARHPPPTDSLPRIELLDVKFHSVTLRLVARDAWTRVEFEALVREHHLMPLSVFDVINEWADEHHGDFLLEGEETIVVHRSILNP